MLIALRFATQDESSDLFAYDEQLMEQVRSKREHRSRLHRRAAHTAVLTARAARAQLFSQYCELHELRRDVRSFYIEDQRVDVAPERTYQQARAHRCERKPSALVEPAHGAPAR